MISEALLSFATVFQEYRIDTVMPMIHRVYTLWVPYWLTNKALLPNNLHILYIVFDICMNAMILQYNIV